MADQHESIDLGGPTVDSSAAAVHSWFPGPPPPIYSCTLTPELVAKAREELQEKPEWRLRDVQALRDMILKVGQNNDALPSGKKKRAKIGKLLSNIQLDLWEEFEKCE